MQLSNRSRARIILGTLIGIPSGAIVAANLLILFETSSRTTSELDRIVPTDVGLVLGCPPTTKAGRPNSFFETRMDAAADLYKSNKVKRLLLSGSATRHYNEPTAMRNALVQRGIPEDSLVLDTEGNRTMESILRAIDHFGLSDFIVVSQGFHTPRAAFLGDHFGALVQGYNAAPVKGVNGLKIRLREWLARLRVFLDIWFRER